MSDQTPTTEQTTTTGQPANRNRLKIALAALGAIVILAGTFYAGMQYQTHRIVSAFAEGLGEASSDLDSATDDTDADVDDEMAVEGEGDGSGYGEPIPMGTPATWDLGEGEQWTVTLDRLECGLTELEDAADKEDYSGTETAYPEDGQTFCVVTSTWENSGKSAAMLEPYSTMSDLVTEDGTEYAAAGEQDETYTRNISEKMSENLNPGKTAEVQNVYTVDDGLAITGVALKPYAGFSETEPLLFAVS